MKAYGGGPPSTRFGSRKIVKSARSFLFFRIPSSSHGLRFREEAAPLREELARLELLDQAAANVSAPSRRPLNHNANLWLIPTRTSRAVASRRAKARLLKSSSSVSKVNFQATPRRKLSLKGSLWKWLSIRELANADCFASLAIRSFHAGFARTKGGTPARNRGWRVTLKTRQRATQSPGA